MNLEEQLFLKDREIVNLKTEVEHFQRLFNAYKLLFEVAEARDKRRGSL